jgi:hypothetical protein
LFDLFFKVREHFDSHGSQSPPRGRYLGTLWSKQSKTIS